MAWRVLDAQFWGVPQRRRRIFLVADFGGHRAGEILFKPESLPWDSAAGGAPGEGVAGNAEAGSGETGAGTTPGIAVPKVFDARGNGDGKTANKMTGDHNGRISDYTSIVINCRNYTVNNISGTLQTNGYSFNPVAAYLFQGFGQYKHSDTGSCLKSRDSKDATDLIQNGFTIRRLTPVECERLQGFPDNWTAYGDNGDRVSYSARYKALGNSVAIPCVEYIMRGIAGIGRE
jgi:DNA (cytosine-5)-methyltransferase 1